MLATWCYYSDKRTSHDGTQLEITDDLQEELHAAAAQTADEPLAFLKVKEVFGDLIENERFTNRYTQLVKAVYEDPRVAKPMEELLSGH